MYVTMSKSEKMPSSCWGKYRKVAVVEVEDGFKGEPKMISERARGVKRVVKEWRRLNVGATNRSAAAKAMAEAMKLCDELNGDSI